MRTAPKRPPSPSVPLLGPEKGSNGPPLLLSVAVLVLCALPYAAGFLTAPRGSVFLGALNNLGDTGQYLAAIRQGMEGHLLYVNDYSSSVVAPALIYPLYTAAGLLAAPLRLSPPVIYLALHAVAALLLLVALWRLCRVAVPAQPRLAFAAALLGGGLYFPVLLLSGVLSLPFAPVILTAPELSLFATLLLSPHGALGLAAELWAFASYLLWRRHDRSRHLAQLAVAGLSLGLCYPFGVPVLLAVVGIDAALRHILPDWRPPATKVAWQGPATKVAQGINVPQDTSVSVLCHATLVAGQQPTACHATLVAGHTHDSRLVLALVPTLGLALYYAVLFHAPPWGASNMVHLPPPDIAVLAAAFGPLLLAALPAVLMRRPVTAAGLGTRSIRSRSGGAGVSPVPVPTLGRARSAASATPPQVYLHDGRASEKTQTIGSGTGRLEADGPREYDRRATGRLEAGGPEAREHVGVSVPHPTAVGPWLTGPRPAAAGPGPARWFAMRPQSQTQALVPAQASVPSRVIIVWAVVNPLLLLLPLPQAGRLVSGWSVALALLAAVTLGRMQQATARRLVAALALSNVTLALLYLAVTWRAANPAYYAPADEVAAVRWVAAHAGPSEVVMASAGSGNLVVSAARCRVVVGQNFETFDWARAQRDVRDFYDTMTDPLARAVIVRRQHVTLVMVGPYEHALGRFNPGEPGYRLVYAGGTVRVYAVRTTYV